MHLSNTMLDVLGTAPVEAVIIYTWSRVLHMRNRAAFYLLMSSCMLVVVLTRGDAGTGMRFAYLVFTGGVLPFLMADERPARKVFVIALMNVAIMIAEVLGTALWYGMTGIDIIDYDNTRAHLGEFAIMHAVHLVLMIALIAALRLALKRGESAGSMNLRLFLWFPVVQALLLTVPLIAGVYARLGSSVLFYGMSVLAIGCFVVDAMLFASMDRYARKRHEDQRAALLQGQLDACLAQCNAFVLEVEQTARMRHDVRNQAHAAMALAERGDYVRARDHISSFRSLYLPK